MAACSLNLADEPFGVLHQRSQERSSELSYGLRAINHAQRGLVALESVDDRKLSAEPRFEGIGAAEAERATSVGAGPADGVPEKRLIRVVPTRRFEGCILRVLGQAVRLEADDRAGNDAAVDCGRKKLAVSLERQNALQVGAGLGREAVSAVGLGERPKELFDIPTGVCLQYSVSAEGNPRITR